MPITSDVTIGQGVASDERAEAAALFWQAFSEKLHRVLGPDPKALTYIGKVLQSRNAICARAADGRIVGLAGMKTRAGGLIGGNWADMASVYGWMGAAWRGPLLELMDRPIGAGQVSLDGICVAPDRQGDGIGAALIAAVAEFGREQGLREVWLEVVDTNPRARALYVREGFRVAGVTELGVSRHVFGFQKVEAMVLDLT